MTVVPETKREMPYQRLVVYQRAVEMLKAIAASEMLDARLREQALKSAKSVCLNIAEAAGRTSPADRARVLFIARGECCEAAAAVDLCRHGGMFSHGRREGGQPRKRSLRDADHAARRSAG